MNKLEKKWREIIFSLVMCFALFVALALFIETPSMGAFLKGSYILAISYALTFFFCGGNSLPDEKTWQSFGDVAASFLGIMFITQIILAILLCFVFDVLIIIQCIALCVFLFIVYLVAFLFFVILICEYKKPVKGQEKQTA